jgi:hypothetical protein
LLGGEKLKKRSAYLSILALLSIVTLLSVIFLSAGLATSQQNTVQYINKGAGGLVYLNLPPAPNSTSPSVPPGTPSRPSDIQLRPYDLTESNFAGAHDAILVYLWVPQRNAYTPVALITDASNTSIYQQIWNNSFIWYKMNTSDASLLNIIQVSDTELQVWSQNSQTGSTQCPDMLIANLTRSVNITLVFNLWPQPQQSWGNLSFTLPPLTLTFREISDKSYYDSTLFSSLPSGWKYQPTAEMRTPAWVEERVPAWLGDASPLEVVGHIDWGYSQTFLPPS